MALKADTEIIRVPRRFETELGKRAFIRQPGNLMPRPGRSCLSAILLRQAPTSWGKRGYSSRCLGVCHDDSIPTLDLHKCDGVRGKHIGKRQICMLSTHIRMIKLSSLTLEFRSYFDWVSMVRLLCIYLRFSRLHHSAQCQQTAMLGLTSYKFPSNSRNTTDYRKEWPL